MKRNALLLACIGALLLLGVAPAQARQKIRGTYTGKVRVSPHGDVWRVTLKVKTLHAQARNTNELPRSSGRVRMRGGHSQCWGALYLLGSVPESGRSYYFSSEELHGTTAGPCRRGEPFEDVFILRLYHRRLVFEKEMAPRGSHRSWFGRLRHLR
jgi:hypothetical protein